jgi:hypothetical protein
MKAPVRRAAAVLVPLLGLGLVPVGAEGDSDAERTVQPTLRVTNLVSGFLAFHEAAAAAQEEERLLAEAEERDPDVAVLADLRRELWEAHLPEAALLLAREAGEGWSPEALEEAWPRYSGVLEAVRGFDGGLSPDPAGVLREVSALLRLDRPLEVHLVLYVGTFDEDPAFRLREGEFTVLLPVETLPGARRPLLIDLMTRAVHARLAGRPAPGRELSLGQHLVIRGLALRAFEELNPGRPAQEYLLRPQSWLLEAEQRDGRILDWVRPRISERDPDRLASFLGGGSVTGLAGEFDYAAWRVSGLLLIHGWSLDRLAREPVGDLDPLVREVLGAE